MFLFISVICCFISICTHSYAFNKNSRNPAIFFVSLAPQRHAKLFSIFLHPDPLFHIIIPVQSALPDTPASPVLQEQLKISFSSPPQVAPRPLAQASLLRHFRK